MSQEIKEIIKKYDINTYTYQEWAELSKNKKIFRCFKCNKQLTDFHDVDGKTYCLFCSNEVLKDG